MIICGIDPGYDRAGYAFLELKENRTFKVLAYGLVSTSKTLSFCDRILELGNDFDELFKRYQAQHLFMEKLFMGRNTTTVLQVSEARGVLRFLAKKNNMEVSEVAPTSIKKTVSGYGAADKTQMIRAITLLLQLPEPPHPDDVADALSVAFCGYIRLS